MFWFTRNSYAGSHFFLIRPSGAYLSVLAEGALEGKPITAFHKEDVSWIEILQVAQSIGDGTAPRHSVVGLFLRPDDVDSPVVQHRSSSLPSMVGLSVVSRVVV